MKRRPEWRAAIAEGCRASLRARDARERAELAVRALVDAFGSSLFVPMMRDAKILEAIERIARTQSGLSSVQPRAIVVYLRRNPEVIEAAIGQRPS